MVWYVIVQFTFTLHHHHHDDQVEQNKKIEPPPTAAQTISIKNQKTLHSSRCKYRMDSKEDLECSSSSNGAGGVITGKFSSDIPKGIIPPLLCPHGHS